MVLPLQEVNVIEKRPNKPGNLWDEYIRVQDINNAVQQGLKKDIDEIRYDGSVNYLKLIALIDKWIVRRKNG